MSCTIVEATRTQGLLTVGAEGWRVGLGVQRLLQCILGSPFAFAAPFPPPKSLSKAEATASHTGLHLQASHLSLFLTAIAYWFADLTCYIMKLLLHTFCFEARVRCRADAACSLSSSSFSQFEVVYQAYIAKMGSHGKHTWLGCDVFHRLQSACMHHLQSPAYMPLSWQPRMQ